MQNEDDQLRAIAKWRMPKIKEPGRLGDIIADYVEKELEPKQTKNASVEQAWLDIVPDVLSAHCRCVGIKHGDVQILVESSVYSYQLAIRNTELLENMRQAAPRLKIKAIKTKVGSLKKN